MTATPNLHGLASHLEGAGREDLVLIALHDGISYSVSLEGAGSFLKIEEIFPVLCEHIATGEIARLAGRP